MSGLIYTQTTTINSHTKQKHNTDIVAHTPRQIFDTDKPLNAVCMSPMRVNRNSAVPSDRATKVPLLEGSFSPVTLVVKAVPPLMLTLLLCPTHSLSLLY